MKQAWRHRERVAVVIWLSPVVTVNIGGKTEYRRRAEIMQPQAQKWFVVKTHRFYRSRVKKVHPESEKHDG